MRRRWRKTWPILITLLGFGLWLAWEVATHAASLSLYVVPTGSMSPTIAPGDRICVDARGGDEPARGEVWAFRMPKLGVFIKRVVGLPGEVVEVAGGRLLVDGRPLAEPYVAGPITYAMPPVRLEAGQYFVLGDNRNASNDSHVWGPLPSGQFIGRVKFRPWPPSRIGGL
jgi:signal peptidase I